MQANKLLFLTALMTATAHVNAQGLLQTIITPDKAVATVNQSLEGTWMVELRPPGLPAATPAIPNLSTYGADGSLIASASDGTQSTAHGVWIRVGDRRFLETIFVFAFDASRALTTITKGSRQYSAQPGRIDVQGN